MACANSLPFVLKVEPVMLVTEDGIGNCYLGVRDRCHNHYHNQERINSYFQLRQLLQAASFDPPFLYFSGA